MRVPLTGAAAGRRLIVNADDFGLTLPITEGTIDAFERGILTSASFVATGDAFARAAQYAASHPDLDAGVHLMIVHSSPVLPPEETRSLVQEDGRFLPGYGEFMARYLSGGVRDQEVEAEWSAQIARLRGAGVRITHLDSHQHLHLVPGLFRIALRIARANGILAMRFPRVPTVLRRAERGSVRRSLEFLPLRLMEQSNLPHLNASGIRTPDRFFGFHSTGHLDQKALRSVLFGVPQGTSELVCHPGMGEPDPSPIVGWEYEWGAELEALTSPETRRIVDSQGIELTTFADLAALPV
ncbi:MAG: ChbG/HpnK family deacetylase [Candidatus Eisenbacteria bacterium]|uniref:ChbG/HpnK family deacetylase n=1 Tax=Eiseniibacteriota bacterium TaxID=2212470 RepID=A0A538TMW3_UNCEI|nr:MAG: ChbG/HpnK family deacetylase [Candidatus Eisenbacteria bacterium]